jgi:protoporphyrinogen IX oxidase
MAYLWVKSLHLVGVISWFAGLFYLVRLFVYHAEAAGRPATERDVLQPQFTLMASRLLHIITTPAMLVTLAAGLAMLWLNPGLLRQPWMHIKLTLLLGLFAYHGWCAARVKGLRAGAVAGTPRGMRIMNEVPTLLLVLIVTYAVVKNGVGAGTALLLAVGLAVVLGVAIQLYGVARGRAEAAGATGATTTGAERAAGGAR